MREHYPGWDLTITLEACLSEIVESWRARLR
jgi:hypothetical protein